MTEPTVEELLARLDNVDRTPTLSGKPCAQAWCKEFKIEPGVHMSVTASEVVKHYKMWCAERGHKPYGVAWFLNYLRRTCGLVRGRDRTFKERRPYLMSFNCAQYFRAWLEGHPLKPGEMLRTSMKTRVEKALEDMGADE